VDEIAAVEVRGSRRSGQGRGSRRTSAGVPALADFHELRHFNASLLIRHGESVKTVQARLGHASAAETLDTYSHLWPGSDDRTRQAVDTAFGIRADSLRTREPT
jgi:integrase